MSEKKGFTLLEVLLSISLVAILTAIGIPVFRSLQQRSDLEISAGLIAESARRAQIKSIVMENDSGWGVKFDQERVIIFKGEDYVGRDAAYDEIFELSGITQYSGPAEIVFVKQTGLPLLGGSIIIGNNNETKTIIINEKGSVAY